VFGAADGGELSLPASSWASITGSATESETAQVSVTKLSKGVVSGPSTATWTFLP